MARCRVLLAITSGHVGGAEAIVADLAQRLDRRQFAPVVCVLREPGKMADVVTASGVPLISFGFAEQPRPRQLVRAVFAMAHEIKTHRIEVVHSFLYRANIVVRLASRLIRNRPAVITGHHSIEPYGGGVVTALSRYTGSLSDRCVVPSLAVRDLLIANEGVPASRVVVIANGIDLSRFHPGGQHLDRSAFGIRPGELVIIAVGRLSHEKAFDVLLRAIAELRREQLAVHLLLVGDGPERTRLRMETRRLGIDRFVHFLGMQSEVQPLYAIADVFVLPSLHEAAPMTVLEAMACGCAVIATSRGGASEMLEGGRYGVLIEPGALTSLVTALRRLAHSPDERRTLASRGVTRVRESFAIERMVDEHARLYLELADARPGNVRGRGTPP